MLATDNSLEHDIIYPRPQEAHIDPYLFKMLTEGAQAPLEAEIVLFEILILHKVIILLID
jgi:hypothetical protein